MASPAIIGRVGPPRPRPGHLPGTRRLSKPSRRQAAATLLRRGSHPPAHTPGSRCQVGTRAGGVHHLFPPPPRTVALLPALPVPRRYPVVLRQLLESGARVAVRLDARRLAGQRRDAGAAAPKLLRRLTGAARRRPRVAGVAAADPKVPATPATPLCDQRLPRSATRFRGGRQLVVNGWRVPG